MSTYTTLKNDYNYNNSSLERLMVYLYPNTSSDDGACENAVANGLDDLGQQALNNNSAYEYYVKISYEHPNLDTSSKDAFWSDWNNYSSRSTYTGVHLAVCTKNFGGRAWSPASAGAWNTDEEAVFGLSGTKEFNKNGVIQETLHPLIDQSISSVSQRFSTSEHELGTVFSGILGDGPCTPMCTSYVDSNGAYARSGTCSSSAPWNHTYTTELTSCTKKSMKETSDSA